MDIRYHSYFLKRFKKLSTNLKGKTISAIGKFTKNPHDPSLQNHKLKGSLAGKRAFWVTGDIRVIFEEFNDYILVIILDVGTHNQVYN
ncbi:type II toxin-antitoxin system YafQ family toxin [Candidatus Peregrinibacteria bacterium]|nr:type II toxin-antitoxin system YafQ family toxin [Candidatus Peregrinibacteria bacterium]